MLGLEVREAGGVQALGQESVSVGLSSRRNLFISVSCCMSDAEQRDSLCLSARQPLLLSHCAAVGTLLPLAKR